MQFYDATTFLPQRAPRNLNSAGITMAYHPETDIYLVGCFDGSIYMYEAYYHEFKRMQKLEETRNIIRAITFLNDKYYAFSEADSQNLFLGTIGKKNMMSFVPTKSEPLSLEHIAHQNLLLSGLTNGCVVISQTDKLPRLRILCSEKAHQQEVYITQSININGKEYIMTGSSSDRDVKLWHFIKGRMRLLKVIHTGRFQLSKVVYLENYKMIAMVSEPNEIMLYKVPSGKLEKTLTLSKIDAAHNLFLMKEKNMIGVTSHKDGCKVIEFVQLSGSRKR